MKISKFSQKIEGLASMGFMIPICNGGVTTLPSFEYENKTNNFVILTPELSDDTSKFLGSTMFVIPKTYIFEPGERRNISLQLFNAYNPNASVLRKTTFLIDLKVIEFDSDSCCSKEEIKVVENVVNTTSTVRVITENRDFIHKYFGEFGKRGKLYKDWAEKGKPVDENNEPILDPELVATNK